MAKPQKFLEKIQEMALESLRFEWRMEHWGDPRAASLSDEEVDKEIKLEARSSFKLKRIPLISAASPVWQYDPETRRALGYYTNAEREWAARLNDARSNSFFGYAYPNFGRLAAYENPAAEVDAFHETALFFPLALIGGLGMGLPSATQAAIKGFSTGWKTTGNLAQKAFSAGTQAVKSATPIITNPRWAATTSTILTPAVASAKNGEGNAGMLFGLGLGFPIAAAWITKGKLWGKAAKKAEQLLSLYKYKPKRGLFAWEHPFKWEDIQKSNINKNNTASIIDEWNSAIGNPSKEQAFIKKYNIKEPETIIVGNPSPEPPKGTTEESFINRNLVPGFLRGELSGYTSTIPKATDYILTGPTGSLKFWMGARNIGRIATGLGAAGLMGLGIYNLSTTPKDSTDKVSISDPLNTTLYPTQKVSDTVPLIPKENSITVVLLERTPRTMSWNTEQ